MAKPVPVLPDDGGPGPSTLADAWVRRRDRGPQLRLRRARADLHAVLSGAGWWFTAVVEGRAEEVMAEEVGAELVAAHLTDPAALRCSIDVLSEHFAEHTLDPERVPPLEQGGRGAVDGIRPDAARPHPAGAGADQLGRVRRTHAPPPRTPAGAPRRATAWCSRAP
ncbi:hypothetical protein [Pseudonocardia sp. ICBG1142]|uniref:hypothetical protein n=1 Tax=Pseudonocardia sp. ICBG1142 TaxID=2846760 RepID=UPI001CF68661|nr:hypothetical protein [Pseudonocardia sp. ICBG1142]